MAKRTLRVDKISTSLVSTFDLLITSNSFKKKMHIFRWRLNHSDCWVVAEYQYTVSFFKYQYTQFLLSISTQFIS